MAEENTEKKTTSRRSTALAQDLSKNFETQLTQIKKQLGSIVDKQNSGVSAEFNALMDGYVNKANESQEYKVKFEHIETVHNDLQIEFKTTKEENRKLKTDLEAAKEALRMSESDIRRIKKDSEQSRINFEEQIAALVEERERLKTKVKQMMDQGEKNSQDYNSLKSELLEYKYKSKQLEQEKQVELEAQQRSSRESDKVIQELKEKLDLRTREVEYKDALLNQVIKQVSSDQNQIMVGSSGSVNDFVAANPPQQQAQEASRASGAGIRSKLKLSLDDDMESDESTSWGAFSNK